MYEIVVKIGNEEFSYGEFYSKHKAQIFLENLYETKLIDSECESWIERY